VDIEIEVGVELVVKSDYIERVKELLVSKGREFSAVEVPEGFLVKYEGLGVLPDVINLGQDVTFEFEDAVTLADVRTIDQALEI